MNPPRYRVWDTVRKKMIYGPTDDNVSSSWVFTLYSTLYKSINIETPGRLILMSTTGVNDVEGTEIWTGDRVEVKFVGTEYIHPGIVEWGSYSDGEYVSNIECFVVSFPDKREDIPVSDDGGLFGVGHHTKRVIGNQYEDPK